MKKKYSSFFNARRDIPKPEQENSVEGIYPSLDEFEDSLEEIDSVLRNMVANMIQKINKDKSDQGVHEVEGSLGLVIQAIRDIDVKIPAMSINQPKVEVKIAPIVLKEDNLTKALMTPKQLFPLGLEIQTIKRKAQIGERDVSTLTKLREKMILKSREYHMSFPKYNGELKQGQAWCANVCFNRF